MLTSQFSGLSLRAVHMVVEKSGSFKCEEIVNMPDSRCFPRGNFSLRTTCDLIAGHRSVVGALMNLFFLFCCDFVAKAKQSGKGVE